MGDRLRSRWREAEAAEHEEALGACVYASRLLGAEPSLVLHGGGNTSVKATAIDLTGEPVEVLYVKGSGWDLATIEGAGFAPLRLSRLLELAALEAMSDEQMMNELRCARLDARAPDPSVEALLHALLPHPAVLHSHADALLAMSDTADGWSRVREAFGERVAIVPYVMPGFDLARRCGEELERQAGPEVEGMVLLKHGLFTWGATPREAYERHVALVSVAEGHVAAGAGLGRRGASPPAAVDPLVLARLRADVSRVAERPMVLARRDTAAGRRFLARADLAEVSQRGPITPDHAIRTKRVPLLGHDVDGYADAYRRWFARHADGARTPVTMLDPAPRVILDPKLGVLAAGRRAGEAAIVHDLYEHTMAVIEGAEALGGYEPISEAEAFEMEYWELEQAKLAREGAPPPLAGEVALVTGAASGIGRAVAEELLAQGAAVIGVDLDPSVERAFERADYAGAVADVTEREQLAAALAAGVERFGGVDVVVASAGVFGASAPLAEHDPAAWEDVMRVNAGGVALLLSLAHPYLKLAPRGGRVVVVGSKNVPAPGPGASAYSASKAAVTQLARVAALEWAADGIRVNVVHPDGVFDTGLWSEGLIAERAGRYGMSPEEYRRRNLLGIEVTSRDVAAVSVALCSPAFGAVTGAQVPIDGGNERVV